MLLSHRFEDKERTDKVRKFGANYHEWERWERHCPIRSSSLIQGLKNCGAEDACFSENEEDCAGDTVEDEGSDKVR